MSMKCKQLEEELVIHLLIGDIDDKMTLYLGMTFITTFQELLDILAKFEKLNFSKSESHPNKSKKNRASDLKRNKTHDASVGVNKRKQTI